MWEKALSDIELQISRPNFVTWFKNSRIVDKRDGGLVIIGLPNNFVKGWVEKNYNKLVLGAIRSIDENVKRVEFIINSQKIKTMSVVNPQKDASEAQLSFVEFKIDPETNLNPHYTLKSFAVGSSNEMAYAAVSAVLTSLGRKYNPLFIYGGVGVGKTHLIQGLGNEIKSRYQGKVAVKYIPSEKFTNEVIAAMRGQRMETIKSKYRAVDVLIVDDIQFIGGKHRTEEEFFHTFNALHSQNKQIILSSDRPPKDIPTLEDRLRSRFEAGMTVDISCPDFELKMAVLKMKLEEKGVILDDKVISFIASKTQKNLRELEGILNKVLFYKEIKKTDVDVRLVDQIISNIVKQPVKNTNPSVVIKCVADYFELSLNDLIGKSRKQEFVEPRQIAIFLLRDLLNLSYPYIADKLGKRDHTTALYSYRKIEKAIQENQILSQKILIIKDLIESV